MSVKRYAAHTNIDDFKSDWHESKDGPMVKYEDYAALEAKCAELAAENAALKSNLIYWDDEDSGPVRSPLDYAHGAGLEDGEEFEMQVAARMPNLTYRVVSTSRFRTEIQLVSGSLPQTPATDAFLAEVRAAEAKSIYESILDNPAVTDMESLVDWLEQHASDAVSFAAQLRQGAEQ